MILTNSRSAIKNYLKYYFVYNGAKSSYDLKIHYQTQNLFLRTFFLLKEEVQSFSFDEETYVNQKNFLILLKNNDKILPKPDEMIKLCLGLLIYNLCFSEAYEQSKLQNSKKESKFMKSQLLTFFYSKIQILENLRDFTKKYLKAFESENIKDLLSVFKKFLEFGVNEIDQLIIEILTNISREMNIASDNIEILINLTTIVETVFFRYKEKVLKGLNENLDDNLVKCIKIQNQNLRSLIEKNHFSLVNLTEIQELAKNEKFSLLNNFIFSLTDLFSNEKSATQWFQIISPILINLFEKLNDLWEHSKLKVDAFYLYLLNFYSICQINMKFKNHLILLFFSIFGILKTHAKQCEENDNTKISDLCQNLVNTQNLINDRNEFKDLLFLCRNCWQELKSMDINCALCLVDISFLHINQLKQEIKEDINNFNQGFVLEVMKFFLAIYLFLGEEKKEKYMHPLIAFVFLFINRSFPNQIISLANQILKHILKNSKESSLKLMLEKIPDELRIVVEGIIAMEKIGTQSTNKSNEEVEEVRGNNEQVNKDAQNQSNAAQAKIKLKLFGSKKN